MKNSQYSLFYDPFMTRFLTPSMLVFSTTFKSFPSPPQNGRLLKCDTFLHGPVNTDTLGGKTTRFDVKTTRFDVKTTRF